MQFNVLRLRILDLLSDNLSNNSQSCSRKGCSSPQYEQCLSWCQEVCQILGNLLFLKQNLIEQLATRLKVQHGTTIPSSFTLILPHSPAVRQLQLEYIGHKFVVASSNACIQATQKQFASCV